MNKTKAKALLLDFLYGSEGAKMWVEDVWGLSPFLGQSAAHSSTVIDLLLETCSERQLLQIMQAVYTQHPEQVEALDSAEDWAVAFGPETAV